MKTNWKTLGKSFLFVIVLWLLLIFPLAFFDVLSLPWLMSLSFLLGLFGMDLGMSKWNPFK